MIHVIATIELNAGARAEFLAAFHELMPLVHAEQGCLEYGPAIDVPTSLPNGPPPRDNTVVIIEKWASLRDLELHLVAPHMHTYRAKVKPLVVGTRLQILEPA